MRDLDDEKRIKEYMEAKMKHIKMYNECMNLADGLDVAKFAELVRADEREACAKIVEADGLARGDEGLVLIKAAGRIRARGESEQGEKHEHRSDEDVRTIEAKLKEKNT